MVLTLAVHVVDEGGERHRAYGLGPIASLPRKARVHGKLDVPFAARSTLEPMHNVREIPRWRVAQDDVYVIIGVSACEDARANLLSLAAEESVKPHIRPRTESLLPIVRRPDDVRDQSGMRMLLA